MYHATVDMYLDGWDMIIWFVSHIYWEYDASMMCLTLCIHIVERWWFILLFIHGENTLLHVFGPDYWCVGLCCSCLDSPPIRRRWVGVAIPAYCHILYWCCLCIVICWCFSDTMQNGSYATSDVEVACWFVAWDLSWWYSILPIVEPPWCLIHYIEDVCADDSMAYLCIATIRCFCCWGLWGAWWILVDRKSVV